MIVYRWYNSNSVRHAYADIIDLEPRFISICGCGLNHTTISYYESNIGYTFFCSTKVDKEYTLEEFMALNKENTYCYPFSNDARDLRITEGPNAEICSCPKKHIYTYNGDESPRISAFYCETPSSWSGSIAKLLDNKIEVKTPEVKPVEDAKTFILTPKEEALVRYIRSIYEAPPDKNIIAALMMTQWIRAQRMPLESDRLIELYDAPKKKGIV